MTAYCRYHCRISLFSRLHTKEKQRAAISSGSHAELHLFVADLQHKDAVGEIRFMRRGGRLRFARRSGGPHDSHRCPGNSHHTLDLYHCHQASM